ncbi:UNVERIFIED_CONTAM: hypothetical protein Sradi_6690700 [Sesamum radiatum]|uniref:Uncharacterized protein n=1 Tax=Sesamum radiatum TaxID=300843 RepID=A0AAW2JP09_SESRA
MGYIYEAMDRAKEAIAASFSNTKEKYKDVFAVIDARWNVQLHRLLHAAGYYFNLEFYYANSNVEQDEEVMQGDTIDTILLDEIDESNEWLLGRLTLDSDEENAYSLRFSVFEDDDLTWGDVARAAGVDEIFEDDDLTWGDVARAAEVDEDAYKEEEEENFDDSNEEETEYRSDEHGDNGNESEESQDYLVELDD